MAVIPATVEKRHVSLNIVCGAMNRTKQLINSENITLIRKS